MPSQLLRDFQSNIHLKNEVKEFLLFHLKDYAGQLALEGKDTKGIKDAKEAIEKAFDELDTIYGPPPVKDLTNPAR